MPQVIKLRPTFKQKRFAQEYIKRNGNGTQAALAVYDTDSPNIAHGIATDNLRKPAVQQTIEEIAQKSGIFPKTILGNFSKIATIEPEKASASDVIKANIELAKILRLYPDKKSTHVRLDMKAKFKSMDFSEAKKAYEGLQEETKDLLEEAG